MEVRRSDFHALTGTDKQNVGRILVHCKNYNKVNRGWSLGCVEWVPVEELETHLKRCPFEDIGCKWPKCETFGLRVVMLRHFELCPMGQTACPDCHDNVARSDLEDHLLWSCQETAVFCHHCLTRTTRGGMKEHLETECSHRIVACEIKGCTEMISLVNMPTHMETCAAKHAKLLMEACASLETKCAALEHGQTGIPESMPVAAAAAAAAAPRSAQPVNGCVFTLKDVARRIAAREVVTVSSISINIPFSLHVHFAGRDPKSSMSFVVETGHRSSNLVAHIKAGTLTATAPLHPKRSLGGRLATSNVTIYDVSNAAKAIVDDTLTVVCQIEKVPAPSTSSAPISTP
jgi:hypothetical protein